MSKTEIKGKEILLNKPAVTIYGLFTDLRRFTENIPEQYKDQVTTTEDSIVFSYGGVNLGIKTDQKVPFSLISFKDDGQSPFPFSIRFMMTAVGLDSTLFHIEVDAELNVMMKMMLGNKLQEMVDTLTDNMETIMNSATPDVDIENIKKEYFS